MGSTATEIRVQCRFGGVAVRRRVLVQKARDGHHKTGGAIPALRRACLEEGRLHAGTGFSLGQTLDGDDVAAFEGSGGRNAGHLGLAVHKHRAGTALLKPAAQLGPFQLQFIPQDIDQGRVRIGRYGVIRTVYAQRESYGATLSQTTSMSTSAERKRFMTGQRYSTLRANRPSRSSVSFV